MQPNLSHRDVCKFAYISGRVNSHAPQSQISEIQPL